MTTRPAAGPLAALAGAALLWAAWSQPPLEGSTARHVEVTNDTVVPIAARVRYTTVIVVPEDEKILTFVCGDSEYWGLEGEANVALLKPMAEGVSTNVALITDKGRIYTLTATEGGDPDLKVYLHRPTPEESGPQRVGTPLEEPRFVAASALEDYARQAELARDQAREAKRSAQELLDSGIEEFRRRYPGTLRFDYRLPPEAAGSPWHVRGMWNDQRFTYLLCDAPEAPALYEEKEGQPAMVAFDYEDGLYVARHVVGAGWLQVGKRSLGTQNTGLLRERAPAVGLRSEQHDLADGRRTISGRVRAERRQQGPQVPVVSRQGALPKAAMPAQPVEVGVEKGSAVSGPHRISPVRCFALIDQEPGKLRQRPPGLVVASREGGGPAVEVRMFAGAVMVDKPLQDAAVELCQR